MLRRPAATPLHVNSSARRRLRQSVLVGYDLALLGDLELEHFVSDLGFDVGVSVPVAAHPQTETKKQHLLDLGRAVAQLQLVTSVFGT